MPFSSRLKANSTRHDTLKCSYQAPSPKCKNWDRVSELPSSLLHHSKRNSRQTLGEDNDMGCWCLWRLLLAGRGSESKRTKVSQLPQLILIFLTQAVAAGVLHQSPADSQLHVQPSHSMCLQCTVSTGPITCYSRNNTQNRAACIISPMIQACRINNFNFKFMLLHVYVRGTSWYCLSDSTPPALFKKEDSLYSVWIAGLQCWQSCQMLLPFLWILALPTFSPRECVPLHILDNS